MLHTLINIVWFYLLHPISSQLGVSAVVYSAMFMLVRR